MGKGHFGLTSNIVLTIVGCAISKESGLIYLSITGQGREAGTQLSHEAGLSEYFLKVKVLTVNL